MFWKKHPKKFFTAEDQERIRRLAQSQSATHRQVQRARILQQYLTGASFTAIAASLKTPRPPGGILKTL